MFGKGADPMTRTEPGEGGSGGREARPARASLRQATVLALALLLTAVFTAAGPAQPSVEAAAASRIIAPVFSDILDHGGEFEMAALAALGVFEGDAGLGGPVRPGDAITRAEFCKVIVAAMGKAGIAASLAGMIPDYEDGESIPAWAWGYVNTARMMGVVKADPYGDGTFRPGGTVSYAEAVTMVVRAVPGHADRVEDGPWPLNYISYAIRSGFAGRVDLSSPSEPCPRSDMAIMLYQAMQIDKLDPFGAPVRGTAVLAGRVLDGALLDCAVGPSMNIVVIDLDRSGTADSQEHFNLAPRVCLAKAVSLEALRLQTVRLIIGTGETAGKVVFVGAVYGP